MEAQPVGGQPGARDQQAIQQEDGGGEELALADEHRPPT